MAKKTEIKPVYDGSTPLKSVMQEMFVTNLFSGQTQTEAYQNAGYESKNPIVQASQAVTYRNIKARIDYKKGVLAKKFKVDEERVTRERVRIGFANIRDFMDEKGQIRPITEIDRDNLASVSEIKLDPALGTITEFKFHNKQTALDALSKQLGLYEADNAQNNLTIVEILARVGGEVPALTGDKPLLEGKNDVQGQREAERS